ncbi:MAG: oligosaccharide flippase family protein [Candidatus Margulisbacteria bacterium]|nr:oligosaccharide flippase family protein [Candidatus Margulisiibacteriota bacterium]
MKKLVAKNFVVYSIPNIISKMLPFIILPITTQYLTLHDFGMLALFNLCLLPFTVLTEYGSGYIINANWHTFNQKERKELMFTLMTIGFVLCALAFILIGGFSEPVFKVLAGEESQNIVQLFLFLCLSVTASIPSRLFNNWVIIEQKALLCSLLTSAQIAISTIAMLGAVMLTQSYQMIIMANVMVEVIFASIRFIILIPNLTICPLKKHSQLILNIGSPIFIRSIFNQIRRQFDKVFVATLFGASQFAIYNFSGRFNQIYELFDTNFSKSFQPSIFKGLSEKNLQAKNIKIILFTWGLITLAGGTLIILFGQIIIHLLTNGLFDKAYPLVVLYTCVFIIVLPFMGHAEIIVFHQKTRYLLGMTVIQAIIIVIASLLLIPRIGAAGGIIAMWVGTLVYMGLYWAKKSQLHPEAFIEKIITPYVVVFHIMAILKYIDLDWIADPLAISLLALIGFHLFRICFIHRFTNLSLFKSRKAAQIS